MLPLSKGGSAAASLSRRRLKPSCRRCAILPRNHKQRHPNRCRLLGGARVVAQARARTNARTRVGPGAGGGVPRLRLGPYVQGRLGLLARVASLVGGLVGDAGAAGEGAA
jgi:hypothetical protein